MTTFRHLNCGTLHVPPNPKVGCHCLLLQDARGLALVDTGIGLEDVRRPLERIGKAIIDMAGFQFHEADTAIRQIESLGLRSRDVKHVVLTHADPDHAGGLADFPDAVVHVAAEELAAVEAGHPRYLPVQFGHGSKWRAATGVPRDWFGLPARPLDFGFDCEVLLVALPGHTRGHSGVAVGRAGRWTLHVGDAYYLRVALSGDDHPLAAIRAEDNDQRLASLGHLRRLSRDHAGEIEMFGYHDPSEFAGHQ